MKLLAKTLGIILVSGLFIFSGNTLDAHASVFTQIPFEFEHFDEADLDFSESEDDSNTGNTALGFPVTIGGTTYDAFDMNSNGYVQLLMGAQIPTNFSFGAINDLINADASSTYLLSGYDDLVSEGSYHGYKLLADRAIFYYDTETFSDIGEDCDEDPDTGDEECEDVFGDFLNNFEVILNSNGSVQWNFNTADFSDFGDDLYSGLYFGNTGTSHELFREDLPEQESWLFAETEGATVIPEPSSMLLLGSGLAGLAAMRGRKKA